MIMKMMFKIVIVLVMMVSSKTMMVMLIMVKFDLVMNVLVRTMKLFISIEMVVVFVMVIK